MSATQGASGTRRGVQRAPGEAAPLKLESAPLLVERDTPLTSLLAIDRNESMADDASDSDTSPPSPARTNLTLVVSLREISIPVGAHSAEVTRMRDLGHGLLLCGLKPLAPHSIMTLPEH